MTKCFNLNSLRYLPSPLPKEGDRAAPRISCALEQLFSQRKRVGFGMIGGGWAIYFRENLKVFFQATLKFTVYATFSLDCHHTSAEK